MRAVVFSLLTILLVFSPFTQVLAEERMNQEKVNHTFQIVEETTLSEVEKAFIEKVKKVEGKHQFGDLYVISLGEKPNSGYTLEFIKPEQTLEQLKLHFKEGYPEKDKYYQDVMVYPYVVGKLQLPPYTTLSLIDQNNLSLFNKKTNGFDFWETRSITDSQKEWTVNFNRSMNQKIVNKFYNIYIETLENGSLVTHPTSIVYDKKNKKSVKIKPSDRYEYGAVYLLSIENKLKNGKKIVIPFHLKEGLSLNYEFSKELQGWSGEFSDLPVDYDQELYGLEFAHKSIPGESNKGLYLSGQNSSDDLFMFAKKKVGKSEGLLPNTTYLVDMEISFYTSADPGLIGIGGAPGESVYVKAGASTKEPKVVQVNGDWRMNINKGEQASSGKEAVVVGDVAKIEATGDEKYTNKTLSTAEPIEVKTNGNGELWLFFGTDSGFEGRTSLYYNNVKVTILKK
ncbi:protease complex subunit PrcB family protein [Cytobacillus sp. FJAT-54145]|uniref:Protease complex subunit PrcB family protein n=1 Tax=Cytobacillus spartinae TaxID=3299023 RepID=A0ABW6KEK0_9BACI